MKLQCNRRVASQNTLIDSDDKGMTYAPSSQLLAALRALDTPYVCRHCSHALRNPARLVRLTSRRTFLSKPAPSSRLDRREERKRNTEQKRLLEQKGPTSHSSPKSSNWELTVGIEIHAELNTARKLFSPALTSLSDTPNTHVAVFDAALPGAQPQFQRETLLPAVRAALALGCQIQKKSSWDRKHYFWWDQPNGYQITQYYEPFAKDGQITLFAHDDIDVSDHPSITVGIKQIQMEQDTAKTILQPPSTHLLDFNRVSHPLIEIITLPQIHTPKTAAALVKKIQSILKTVDANTTGMEMGGLRADVNVSVRKRDQRDSAQGLSYGGVSGLGQRTEIKNLNSFKAVEEAIEAERDRQIAVLEASGVIEGETRGWTLGSSETHRIRGKEGEVDYRYMPDPDLGPLIIGQDLIDHLRATLPQLPDATLQMLTDHAAYGVTQKDAKTLITLDGGDRLDYYFRVVHLTRQRLAASAAADSASSSSTSPDSPFNIGRFAANWVLHELGAVLSTSADPSWAANRASASHLAQILVHRLLWHITAPTAKRLLLLAVHGSFEVSGGEGIDVETREAAAVSDYIHEKNLRLKPVSDKEYLALATKLVDDNPKMAEAVMKEEAGRVAVASNEDREKGSAAQMGDGKAKGKKDRSGKIMWFVGQMLGKGDGPRMVPDRCERAVRKVLARATS